MTELPCCFKCGSKWAKHNPLNLFSQDMFLCLTCLDKVRKAKAEEFKQRIKDL